MILQDIEFTVQEGRLWMLQCRSGKRTGAGAVKIAVDMVLENLIDKRAAIQKVEPQHLDQLLHPQVRYDLNIKKSAEYAGNYVLVFDHEDNVSHRYFQSVQKPELSPFHHAV